MNWYPNVGLKIFLSDCRKICFININKIDFSEIWNFYLPKYILKLIVIYQICTLGDIICITYLLKMEINSLIKIENIYNLWRIAINLININW